MGLGLRAGSHAKLPVDGLAQGLVHLERRRSGGVDVDGLAGRGVAAPSSGAISDGELAEPRDGRGFVARTGVGDGRGCDADQAIGGAAGRGRLRGNPKERIDRVLWSVIQFSGGCLR